MCARVCHSVHALAGIHYTRAVKGQAATHKAHAAGHAYLAHSEPVSGGGALAFHRVPARQSSSSGIVKHCNSMVYHSHCGATPTPGHAAMPHTQRQRPHRARRASCHCSREVRRSGAGTRALWGRRCAATSMERERRLGLLLNSSSSSGRTSSQAPSSSQSSPVTPDELAAGWDDRLLCGCCSSCSGEAIEPLPFAPAAKCCVSVLSLVSAWKIQHVQQQQL